MRGQPGAAVAQHRAVEGRRRERVRCAAADAEGHRASGPGVAGAHIDDGCRIEAQPTAAGGDAHLATAGTGLACVGDDAAASDQCDVIAGVQLDTGTARRGAAADAPGHIESPCIDGQRDAACIHCIGRRHCEITTAQAQLTRFGKATRIQRAVQGREIVEPAQIDVCRSRSRGRRSPACDLPFELQRHGLHRQSPSATALGRSRHIDLRTRLHRHRTGRRSERDSTTVGGH